MTERETTQLRVRHKKRGTTYRIVGPALLQTETPLSDMAEVIIYRCEAVGVLWVRSKAEFEDGRFEPAEEPPEPDLPADMTRALPSGLDDATYEEIETALDRIEAPMTAPDGRWLKLHERVAAITPAPTITAELVERGVLAMIEALRTFQPKPDGPSYQEVVTHAVLSVALQPHQPAQQAASGLIRDDLSKDAHVVGGAMFGMMQPGKGRLVFHTPSKIFPRTKVALDELVAKGLVTVGPTDPPGGLIYVPQHDFWPFQRWLSDRGDDPEVRFPLTNPEGPT